MAVQVAVAVSGGRDSTALLHATARAARGTGIEVHALHVHHGLLPQADSWVEHVRNQCRRWKRAGLPVQFHVTRLKDCPAPGDSVEAWARRERYRVLAIMARELGIDTVLLAHHRRDQAETLLLQALRGAGAAGLAAMPRAARRDGIQWLRPWLDQPRSAIEAYVQRFRLRFVDDASNADPRFARNRLRLAVWPALQAAFPDAEAALSAASRRAHEAAVCAAELAVLDLPACVDAQGRLRVRPLSLLMEARRANVLRHWLSGHLVAGVPETLVRRLLKELAAGNASWRCDAGWLRLHRGLLHAPVAADAVNAAVPMRLDLSRTGTRDVPTWGGVFEVRTADGLGIPAHLLERVELRAREGGEQFQRTPRSVARSLKKQFQTCGVPEWERAGPLVYAGAQLLFVPGLGIDGRVHAMGGEPVLQLHWQRTARA